MKRKPRILINLLIVIGMLVPMGVLSASQRQVGEDKFVYFPVTSRDYFEPFWEEVGANSARGGGISNFGGYIADQDIAISPDGIPYIVWEGLLDGGVRQIYVRRWNGVEWEETDVGSASGGGISDDLVHSSDPSIAVAPDGTPYISWSVSEIDSVATHVYVRRFNGVLWEVVGTGIATDIYSSSSIAIDPAGIPYVTYACGTNPKIPLFCVQRWNGTEWEGFGSSGGNNPVITSAADGVLYIATVTAIFATSAISIGAHRWNGAYWEYLGSPSSEGGTEEVRAVGPSMAIDPNGILYLAWLDVVDTDNGDDYSNNVYVKRWNGASWEEVGSGSASGDGISGNLDSGLPEIAINNHGTPYITWSGGYSDDGGDNSDIYVRQWNGNDWVEVGTGSSTGGGISKNSGESWSPAIDIAPDGTPYIAWQDNLVQNESYYPDSDIYVRRWVGD